jgi:hypothetical protein
MSVKGPPTGSRFHISTFIKSVDDASLPFIEGAKRRPAAAARDPDDAARLLEMDTAIVPRVNLPPSPAMRSVTR